MVKVPLYDNNAPCFVFRNSMPDCETFLNRLTSKQFMKMSQEGATDASTSKKIRDWING